MKKKKKKKKKILFVLPSLVAGGAERVISFVAQNISVEQFDATLVIISSSTPKAYKINETLKTVYLNKRRVLSSIPALCKIISKDKPDIVLSSISHLNIVMALISPFYRRTKFIAREATVAGKRTETKSLKNSLNTWLIKMVYPMLDRIICQSADMKKDLIDTFGISDRKMVIINNPITFSDFPISVKEPINYNKPIAYITVGRLVKVKGHVRIIQILSELPFDFTYTIIGDGPLKKEIFQTIDSLGLNEKVTHIPYTQEVYKYLINSDIFLQGSYVEGFPNATLESCTVGTPVIAFNAPGGTKEIIENGINGFIVDHEQEFAKRLNERYDWNVIQIKNSVHQKFGAETILSKFEQLFSSI